MPAPVPITGTRPTVPPQHAPRPHWPSAPLGGAKQLAEGSRTLTWPLLVRAITDTVGSQYVDEIDLRVTRSPRAAVSIPVRMCRAIDGRPYFVACLVPTDHRDVNTLGAAGWHLWRPKDVLRFDEPQRLLPVPAPVAGAEAGCVATWRAPSPLELARALAVALHGLTATPSCKLHATIRRALAARRDAELHDIERQRRAASRSSTKPVRGFCQACGQPLRDPSSLQRGYGPECYERLRGKHDPSLNINADIPLQYWVGAQPLPTVRRSITDWLRSLPQPAARDR